MREITFVQDAHHASRFFVACPDLLADCRKFCRKFCADRRKFCADVDSKPRDVGTQDGKVGGHGGYLFRQLA